MGEGWTRIMGLHSCGERDNGPTGGGGGVGKIGHKG